MLRFHRFKGYHVSINGLSREYQCAETAVCPHCLSDDHSGASCPHNPMPPILGWFQGSAPSQYAPATPPRVVPGSVSQLQCRFTRCRYSHICSDCGGPTWRPQLPPPTASPRRLGVGQPGVTEEPTTTVAPLSPVPGSEQV